MFVAGLALTRFLKASAERRQSHEMQAYRGYSGGPRFGDEADYSYRLPSPAQATHQFDSVAAGATGGMGSTGAPATIGTLGTSATAGSTGSPGAAPSLSTDPVSIPAPSPTLLPSTQPEVH
jgi:hypothetical protein